MRRNGRTVKTFGAGVPNGAQAPLVARLVAVEEFLFGSGVTEFRGYEWSATAPFQQRIGALERMLLEDSVTRDGRLDLVMLPPAPADLRTFPSSEEIDEFREEMRRALSIG